ncbi:hypothetical protein [Absidia glauca]|uniref:Uncharacterized protein n=1 Tax=Absidia glauca TaxID=4829 RepID=A0A163JSD4_ABSGL|nr:hypothetical protein [Absidia glauca]
MLRSALSLLSLLRLDNRSSRVVIVKIRPYDGENTRSRLIFAVKPKNAIVKRKHVLDIDTCKETAENHQVKECKQQKEYYTIGSRSVLKRGVILSISPLVHLWLTVSTLQEHLLKRKNDNTDTAERNKHLRTIVASTKTGHSGSTKIALAKTGAVWEAFCDDQEVETPWSQAAFKDESLVDYVFFRRASMDETPMVHSGVPQIGTLKREWDTISLNIPWKAQGAVGDETFIKRRSSQGGGLAERSEPKDLSHDKSDHHSRQRLLRGSINHSMSNDVLHWSPSGKPCAQYSKLGRYMGLLTTTDPFGAADQLAPPPFRRSLH